MLGWREYSDGSTGLAIVETMPGRVVRRQPVTGRFQNVGRTILQKYGELEEVLGGGCGIHGLNDTLAAWWLAQTSPQQQKVTCFRGNDQVRFVVWKGLRIRVFYLRFILATFIISSFCYKSTWDFSQLV